MKFDNLKTTYKRYEIARINRDSVKVIHYNKELRQIAKSIKFNLMEFIELEKFISEKCPKSEAKIWFSIIRETKMSEHFIENYLMDGVIRRKGNLLDELFNTRTQDLSPYFIDKYLHRITKRNCMILNMSLQFIEKHIDEIDFFHFAMNDVVPQDVYEFVIDKYSDRKDINWLGVSDSALSIDFYEKHIDKLYMSIILNAKAYPSVFPIIFAEHIRNYRQLLVNTNTSFAQAKYEDQIREICFVHNKFSGGYKAAIKYTDVLSEHFLLVNEWRLSEGENSND